MGKQWKQWLTLFLGAPKALQIVIAAMKLKDTYSSEGEYDQPRQHIKKQRFYFVNKDSSSQSYGFSSSHVWMWELDYKESWTPKNWCFWTVVLKKSLESHLDCKEIQPVYPKGDQSWVFIGRTDVETNTLATWCEELTHLKRPWCWERLRAGGEGHGRGWDGWMASPTQWIWVWVDFGSWWWTGRPGVLRFMGLQRVRHNWVTSLVKAMVFPVVMYGCEIWTMKKAEWHGCIISGQFWPKPACYFVSLGTPNLGSQRNILFH